MYIHIYRERGRERDTQRERERERETHTHNETQTVACLHILSAHTFPRTSTHGERGDESLSTRGHNSIPSFPPSDSVRRGLLQPVFAVSSHLRISHLTSLHV